MGLTTECLVEQFQQHHRIVLEGVKDMTAIVFELRSRGESIPEKLGGVVPSEALLAVADGKLMPEMIVAVMRGAFNEKQLKELPEWPLAKQRVYIAAYMRPKNN